MTNILNIPLISGVGTAFSIANNSDWVDSIFFGAPNSAAAAVAVGAVTLGSPFVQMVSVAGIDIGMPFDPTSGFPVGGYIWAISSGNEVFVGDVNQMAINASANDNETTFMFQPVPLDLSGIELVVNLRKIAGGADVYVVAQTSDGTMVNGGKTGIISFSVPQSTMQYVEPGSYLLDILAIADGHVINLMPDGPASVTVNEGVTWP